MKTKYTITIYLLIMLNLALFAQNQPDTAKNQDKPGTPGHAAKQLSSDAWGFISPVAAKVGETQITKGPLTRVLDSIIESYSKRGITLSANDREFLAKSVANRMVRDVILSKLAADAGYQITPEIEKNASADYLKSFTDTQRRDIDADMKKYGFIPKNDTEERALKTVITKWAYEKIKPTVTITDAQAKDYYEKNKGTFYKDSKKPEEYIPYDKVSETIKIQLTTDAVATKIRAMVDEQMKKDNVEIYVK